MLWDEPKIFFLERRYFFSIILSEFLKNRVALQYHLLFNAITDALKKIEGQNYGDAKDLLIAAQQKAEEIYITAED